MRNPAVSLWAAVLQYVPRTRSAFKDTQASSEMVRRGVPASGRVATVAGKVLAAKSLPSKVGKKESVVGSAVLTKPGKSSVKNDGAWRYPNGVIERATTKKLGPTDKLYVDHKDRNEPRRKQESNFFITINTNRKVTDAPRQEDGKRLMNMTLDILKQDEFVNRYMKFGPKNPEEYGDDLYADVIQRVEWESNAEYGENYSRLHAHIWMTVHHYSQVQINITMLQFLFKQQYQQLANREFQGANLQMSSGRPYVQVKLLPTANWAEVIKGYIHKAMTTPG